METFLHDKILPDVIDDAPANILKVTYDTGIYIQPGMVVTPTQVQNKPSIHYDSEPWAFYTLLMHGTYQRTPHDLNAETRNYRIHGEWQHWMVANIPENKIHKGQIISEYHGAGPPKQTGLHRYVFLVYKQDGEIDFDLPKLSCDTLKGRAKHKVRDLCSRYRLRDLVAANYFKAEWDDYVTQLYAQFR